MAVSDIFRGTGVAMITPFQKNGDIDFDGLSEHTDRLIREGIDYLVVLGTTAETPALSAKEKAEVLDCVVNACSGRVPVVLGVGGNDTRAVTDTLKAGWLKGIQGILSVSPYYNKPTQEGIYQHFSAVASISDWPVILYNVPGRTASNMEAATSLRLANDHQDVIVAIKEASGSLGQIMDILEGRPEGFLVISGDDALTCSMMALGGEGVISVIGNAYPSRMSAMVSSALEGNAARALELHYQLYPMMKAIFKEGNPSGIKASMEMQGWIDNVLRLPLIPVTSPLYEEISRLNADLQSG